MWSAQSKIELALIDVDTIGAQRAAAFQVSSIIDSSARRTRGKSRKT